MVQVLPTATSPAASPRRIRRLGVAAAALTAYGRLLRPRLNAWGATRDELEAVYPGDDLIPDPCTRSTMATTIAASPAAVWAWLVQMGCDRGGFYSWDRLDNGGRPSADRIHREWQDLEQGDRITSVPDGSVWFDVAVLERDRVLVLRASLVLSLPKPRCFDPAGAPPRAYSDSTWGFFLAPARDGATRLVVHGVGAGRPRAAIVLMNLLLGEPAHWIMQRRQFTGLRRRAESSRATWGIAGADRGRPVPAAPWRARPFRPTQRPGA
jgi:hypothetical protein